MKEVDILDVDALAPKPRTVILGGQEHKEEILTLKQYVELVRDAKELSTDGDDEISDAEKAEKFAKDATALIQRSFPSINAEMISGLSMAAMSGVVEFCINAPEEAVDPEKKDKAAQ